MTIKKMFTKMSVAVLLIALTLSSVPRLAFAIDGAAKRQMEAEYYAYMDLETADARLTEIILEARNEIIFSQSWVADGIVGYIEDQDGNIVSMSPQFSDLFPLDWDIPIMDDSNTVLDSPKIISDVNAWVPDSAPLRGPLLTGEHYLYLVAPPSNTNTAPFTYYANPWLDYDYTDISTQGACSSIGSGYTFNIGYSNRTTGASLGWQTHLPSGYSYRIKFPTNTTVNIRASTYSTPCDWVMFSAAW